jgi:hypothetical protein
VLALSAGVLRTNLLAIDALYRETLTKLVSNKDPEHGTRKTYFVFLLCTKFNERSMHIIERRSREIRGALSRLL